MALQFRAQIYLSFPGDARNLVIRVRLRWKRSTWKKVSRFADRVGSGSRRGVARRAHADSEADQSERRGQVRHGRVPVRVWKDKSRNDDPNRARLEGRNNRR